MEENQGSSLFGLGIDPTTKAHLSESARWARFLAIVGIVLCAFFLLSVLVSGLTGNTVTRFNSNGETYSQRGGIGGAVFSIVYAIFIFFAGFFPCLFLLRYSNKLKTALNGNDQESLNASFQNLKVYFRYIGIVAIIMIALVFLSLLFVIVGLGALR